MRLDTLLGRVPSPSRLFHQSREFGIRIVVGFVGIGQTKKAKFHVRRLPFMFPVVVVMGFILWKWANGSDSAAPNLVDCRIGSKVFSDGSSHCFTSIRKLGTRRRSDMLRCFNSSNGTNLAILIILAGDTETNPGPRSQCSVCKQISRYRKR